MEVFVRFFGRNFRGDSFYMYLSFEFMPDKGKGYVWILCQVFSFAAFVVGVENKLSVMQPFQQYGAGRGSAFGRYGAYDDGGRLFYI